MFESGLTYVKTDFHLHTHKDKEFKYSGEQNSFVKDYIMALKQAGIGVGIITNHNKFDKDEYSALRRAAKKEDIFILPGVELTVKEGANGVHTLIVFNPAEWLANGENHIQTFLTSAFATISNPENSNTKCTYDLRNTIEALDKYGRDYFIVFAHVDQNSGLFSECSGGLLKSLSEINGFRKRVLGLQKATNRDNINQFKTIFKYEPALVEGSDPKSISDIGKGTRYTYLKIGEYSFSSIKFALQDSEYRIFDAVPTSQHGYIDSVLFEGGKFDGQCIRFSPELNTLIGVRGSGKSAVLEVIRYVLGLEPQTDKDYKDSLVKNVLVSGGKATLIVVDKHGRKYTVSRILGERTTVIEEAGIHLSINPVSIFDGVQYFGQKDLSSSADHENSLLEKLISGKIGHQASVDNYVKELTEAVDQLLDVDKIPEQIEEEKTAKSEVEHKISIYKEKGVAEKLEKQAVYTTDKTKFKASKGKIESVVNAIKNVYDSNHEVSSVLAEHTSKYNSNYIIQAQKVLTSIDQELEKIGAAVRKLQEYEIAFEDIIQKLEDEMGLLADEFAEIKREIKDTTLDADTFVQLTADLEKHRERLNQLEKKSNTRDSIKDAFTKAKNERNEALLNTFNDYKAEIEKINKSQIELRIEITFKGDKDEFKSRLKTDFRGSGITDIKYQSISEKFSDYVALIEDWIIFDGAELRSILTPVEYGKLDQKLREQYNDLLSYQVQNKVEIYYHNKLLKQHSIGQRASALILFILTQNNNDIVLIDQPEDDLDNKVIYDEVISTIVKKKPNIQFIFATHNANIPVLGDAEKVLVTDYQDTIIKVTQGNIDLDDTHKQIVDIMEGGKDAFEKRQLIYESWR